MSVPSMGRFTERTQAKQLATLYLESLRREVRRVYWHSLSEAPDVYRERVRKMTKGRHLFIGSPEDVLRAPYPQWQSTSEDRVEMLELIPGDTTGGEIDGRPKWISEFGSGIPLEIDVSHGPVVIRPAK